MVGWLSSHDKSTRSFMTNLKWIELCQELNFAIFFNEKEHLQYLTLILTNDIENNPNTD